MTSQPTPRPPRAALYARVSTTGHGQDVGLQLDELRQVAAQRGWEVTEEHVYVDDGVSGVADSRPALDRLIVEARSGKLDLVAIWKLDRLGRDLRHLLSVCEDLTSWGVGLISLRDSGIDTTSPQGKLLLAVLGAFASFERDLLRERVIAGVRRAQAAGKHCGRPRREIDLRAANLLLAQGLSVRQVAEMLSLPRATLQRRLQEAQGRLPPPVPAVDAEHSSPPGAV